MKQQKESRAPDLPHPFFFLCWTPNYFISLHYLDFVIVQEPNPLTQTQIPTISSFEVLDGKFLLFSKMGSWFSVCLVREMARVEWVSQKQGKKMESWIDNMRRVCWESVCVLYINIYIQWSTVWRARGFVLVKDNMCHLPIWNALHVRMKFPFLSSNFNYSFTSLNFEFFISLNHFNIIILKIILKIKKYYFNTFLKKNHFKNQSLSYF
jgi:hypothetical protein